MSRVAPGAGAIQFEPYGLAITKTTGRREGFNPVWYSDISRRGYDWPAKSVNRMIDDAVARATTEDGEVDVDRLRQEAILQLTPFFEQMGRLLRPARSSGGSGNGAGLATTTCLSHPA